MTIYETIKVAISVKQAAEHYELKVNRDGVMMLEGRPPLKFLFRFSSFLPHANATI